MGKDVLPFLSSRIKLVLLFFEVSKSIFNVSSIRPADQFDTLTLTFLISKTVKI